VTRAVRGWGLAHAALVAGFLAVVAGYHRPGLGFTAFLTLAAERHDTVELPAARGVPHVNDPSAGYDGQYYAQLALDPLLRDPAIDVALDNPPYRARRILLSWTAFLAGFGRPAWILAVFAVQNVVAWLVAAWLLLRWFPVGTPRSFVLWASCLLTHGMLASVRYALVDGPSIVLLGWAIVAAETARPWWSAVAVGIAGLARETNVLASVLLVGPIDWSSRSWMRTIGRLVVAGVPLALWLDYLRSIYLGSALGAGQSNLALPLNGLMWKVEEVWRGLAASPWDAATIWSAAAIVSFATQAVTIAWLAVRRGASSPWLPVAAAFGVLGLFADQAVWDGSPGAITRVALPLAIGFNVLARTLPWPVLVLGNLTVLPGVVLFVSGRA